MKGKQGVGRQPEGGRLLEPKGLGYLEEFETVEGLALENRDPERPRH